MSDWIAIQANSRKSGHFAGSSSADESVYFEFFGGQKEGAKHPLMVAVFSAAPTLLGKLATAKITATRKTETSRPIAYPSR